MSSSIPTKQIDGDVAVGRNANIGGKANVRGSMTVGHNLTVEGWLEAKNIKGPNKGLFKTVTQLREAYPNPHEGWWALVTVEGSASSDHLGQLYVADGGTWVAQVDSSGNPLLKGNPTVDSTEYMEAVEEMTADLEAVKVDVNQNKDDIKSLRSTQTSHTDSLNTLNSQMSTAQTDISTLKKTVSDNKTELAKSVAAVQSNLDTFKNTKGEAGGLVPLDDNGQVPSQYLPVYVDDVLEFSGIVSGITAQMSSLAKSSSDDGCSVVYNEDTDSFVLAYATTSMEMKSVVYYNNWLDGDVYGETTLDGRVPHSGKVYMDVSTNKTYRWGGTTLVVIGSDLALGHTSGTAFPGNEGVELQEQITQTNNKLNNTNTKIEGINAMPFDGVWDGTGKAPGSGIWYAPSEAYEGEWCFRTFGGMTFDGYGYAEENYNTDEVGRDDHIYVCGTDFYHIVDKKMQKLGGSSVGNTYNATVELPLDEGEYYSDIAAEEQTHNVLEAVYGAGKASLGLQITFAIGPSSWKTYQYVGLNKTHKQFVEERGNWIDLAGMSAGTESVININKLCGDDNYTLSTAIQTLIAYEESSGINYRKEGLVITYRRNAEPIVWETKQYQGNIHDMTPTNEAQWQDFGGGGNTVETTDTVEKDNDKAITSGGVYEALQTKTMANFNDESTADDYVFQAVNEKGDKVGDPIKIPRSNGGGTASGSTLNIYPESQAVWGAFGSKIVLKAAIKSVSFDGDTEILGTIKTISIMDATTKIVLWSDTVNTASSTSATNFTFEFDFTDYITSASSKDFIIAATDADGNSKTRTITVTAVDVTCTCIQTLYYSSSTALEVGGKEKSLPMYKFENNVSTKQGILVTTEMYYKGKWRTLGTATVTDSYSHNISINPNNVFGGGEKLEHGSYPLSIHGTDIASGVEGNVIHTAVMCVDASSTVPIVVLRFDDNNNGKIRLYDNLTFDIAAYTPGKTSTKVGVMVDGTTVTTVNCPISQTYKVSKQIQGYASDGTKSIDFMAYCDDTTGGTMQTSETIRLTVEGSAIDATVKEGALFAFDFSTRSNSEADHTIKDGDYTMSVKGSNWNSNGFVTVLGETALRIAENVKAEIPYAPFSSSALETSGMALQMAFSTKSIKDKNAMLCECYDPTAGVGFYVKGNEVVLTVQSGTPKLQRVGFKCSEKITIAVVVEPGSKYVTYKANGQAAGTNYSFVKLYVNGEECASIGYQPGTSALRQNKTITFNSENGDISLNYIMAYGSYMEWLQAFRNYLCKLSDVKAMIAEYDKENVLDTTGKPSMPLMEAKGMPYYVIVADQTTFNNYDYALNGGTNTSDQFSCTLYYFNPKHPEVSFKAINVLWRRQGTTSAQRPIKNDRFNFNKKNKATGKKATVTLLNPDSSTELGRKAIMAAKHNKVFVSEKGLFVDVITVKVDYSDSSNSNDCGVCDLMNATFRALGSAYQTPAQRAFDGTQDLGDGDVLTGLEMDHSTKNHPVACFRATSDTLQDAWFHAKGNWKEDKGEQTALGFKDTPGYNKGCLNYGDFIEYFGEKDETLAQTEARFKKESDLDTGSVYLISQYCGQDYAIYRYKDGAWKRSTGSMKQVNGKWQVTGDVLNPVTGYELLQYAGMDWWQGVTTVEDMMKPIAQKSSWVNKLGLATETYPAWTYYFECMIDNDQLQEDLALGKKVPYDLFNLLRFFDSCDYSKVDGWQKIWKENAYRYMSLESAMAYTAFTDYLAAVDQRAKNMQPMFFLEDGCSVENGVYSGYKNMMPTRMYLNKVYDCDTCNGSDNDGGKDIDAEVDPNKPTNDEEGYTNPYMGSGSVLFNDIDQQQECWNSNDLGATTISLKSVVNKMRNQTSEIDGKTMVPFSPDGATHFFVDERLMFWPKVVSSYDGERKYIDHTSIANMPYFYALHGLGLTSLPRFIEQRWAIRDGYYQTGDFFTNPLSGRVSAISSDSKIYITAAATGYFGIGNDASGQLSETVFLEAGQSHAFTNFAHDAGALLYIYQPGRMSKIDLSEMTLAFHFNDLSKLVLAEEIVLGGAKHTANSSLNGFEPLSNVKLGDMPFLRKLDVSKTSVTSIDASGCPRMESINASYTQLTSCDIAQTSPIEALTLPSTVTKLELVNLPKLAYPGGLTMASMANISRLWVEGCSFVDTESLVLAIAETGSVKEVRIPNINMTASVKVLRQLKKTGATGLDATGKAYDETGQCSGITGRWILSELIEEDDADGEAGLKSLAAYFPELTLINSQFSIIKIDDIVSGDFCERYSNPENETGSDYDKQFVASGHTLKILQNTHAYKCTYNSKLKQMEGVQLSDTDFNKLANGESFDVADSAGEGFDIFHHLPHFWYKGVNDYKNQQKYIIHSTTESEPLSTVTNKKETTLSKILYAENTGIYADEAQDGATIDANVIATAANVNAYRMDVEGMKQVRWPGLNHARLGAVFTDADGKIVGKFIMMVSHIYFDFTIGNYVFCDVPGGAKWMYFTSYRDIGDKKCLAVDSSSIEAIEPEWTEHTVGENDSLVGTYPITIDGLKRPRSLSGAVRSKKGDNTSQTSSEWAYDSDGNPTETPNGTLHYTDKDFQNSTRRRGEGYQLQDYEQHKEISNLWWATHGTTNEQAIVGNGAHDATLNSRDDIGMADTAYVGNSMNSIMGLKHYVGCDSEWMDYIAGNVKSYDAFYKNRCVETNDDPIDYVFHIYDPIKKTERTVQSVTSNGNCVVRVVHGAKCDILPSKVHQTDTSKYTTHYAAGLWFPGSRGRCVLRSGYYSHASSGLAYAIAYIASSNSSTNFGGRLAFRGKFVIVG